MIVITGARVLSSDGLVNGDIAIENGVISQFGSVEMSDEARVIAADGLVVGPGFVDIHVHFRDPGSTWKEDITSGSRAAAAGGYTAVVMMPNTDPAIDNRATLKRVQDAAKSAAIEVVAGGALTKARDGTEMASLDDLYDGGVRIFSDDGDTVADAGVLRKAMKYLSDRQDVVVAQHAEDPDLAGGGHLHEGEVAARLGVAALASSAEEVILARDLILAAEDATHYHVQHLSTAGSVELVRRAKEAGHHVTAEVTPHHLALTENDVATLDTNFKMYPPLRSESDRIALVAALGEGVIDAVATDHAPHTAAEKDVPFEEAPRGVIGLETAFPVVLNALGGDLLTTFERMSIAPARIARLANHGRRIEVGSPANLVIVDPSAEWTVESFVSRSANSPFVGSKVKGKIVATIYKGDVVWEVDQ